MTAAQCDAIRSLALLSGFIPRKLIEEVMPGLFHQLTERLPVGAAFERVDDHGALLFPRVRRAALTCPASELGRLRAEVEQAPVAASAAPHAARGTAGPGESSPPRRTDHSAPLRGVSCQTFNLDSTPFEGVLCMELIEDLETSTDLHGDQAAGSLIELLGDEASAEKTNLGLLARARLTRLKGWFLRSGAGTDAALLHGVGMVLDNAQALAEHCYRRERFGNAGGASVGQRERSSRETLILTMQARMLAGLVQSRCWHRLLGLPARQSPEDTVMAGVSLGALSLWGLCGLDPEQDLAASSPPLDISPKVLAMAYRVLALGQANAALRAGKPIPPSAWGLCERAAEFNRGLAEDGRARNLLEAALLRPARQVVACTKLAAQARSIFTRELRRQHPGLAPYLTLLQKFIARRHPGAVPIFRRHELSPLRQQFKEQGENYFAELVSDLQRVGAAGRRTARRGIRSAASV